MIEEEIRQRAEEAIQAMKSSPPIGDVEEQNASSRRVSESFLTKILSLMRLVFLDSKPLGMVANPGNNPDAARCRRWAASLLGAGVRVFVPEICDYETRRKRIHVGSTSSLARLDRLKIGYDYAPITTDVMQLAAELWAQARQRGTPTAPPEDLDGDVILAATAILSAGPADVVTVATDNVGHLGQFVNARPWELIVP